MKVSYTYEGDLIKDCKMLCGWGWASCQLGDEAGNEMEEVTILKGVGTQEMT